MSYDLKRCPFCGSDADIGDVSKTNKPHYVVYCTNRMCGARTREFIPYGTSRIKKVEQLHFYRKEAVEWAIDAWNRRAGNAV